MKCFFMQQLHFSLQKFIFSACSEEERLLEAIVVLDEFCKELAAISLVKYHLYSS